MWSVFLKTLKLHQSQIHWEKQVNLPQDMDLRDVFNYLVPERKTTKTKNIKWDGIEFKSLCMEKEMQVKIKKTPY